MSEGEPAADSLAADAVAPLLHGAFGTPYRFEAQCPSTQALLDTGLPEGAVAVCDQQVAGAGASAARGRRRPGRRSSAPCSCAPAPSAARPSSRSSAASRPPWPSRTRSSAPSQIKWPNDVMVNGSKVAGVLAERRDGVVVLGIGLNVNQRPRGAAGRHEGSGRVALHRRRRQAGAGPRCWPRFSRTWSTPTRAGRWARSTRSTTSSGPRLPPQPRVTVDGERGVGVGIDRSGRLEVEIAGERRIVESGEIVPLADAGEGRAAVRCGVLRVDADPVELFVRLNVMIPIPACRRPSRRRSAGRGAPARSRRTRTARAASAAPGGLEDPGARLARVPHEAALERAGAERRGRFGDDAKLAVGRPLPVPGDRVETRGGRAGEERRDGRRPLEDPEPHGRRAREREPDRDRLAAAVAVRGEELRRDRELAERAVDRQRRPGASPARRLPSQRQPAGSGRREAACCRCSRAM